MTLQLFGCICFVHDWINYVKHSSLIIALFHDKVIIAVMLMLAVFFFTDVSFVPDARQVQLDALAKNPGSEVLRKVFFQSNGNLIRLSGSGNYFVEHYPRSWLNRNHLINVLED